MNLFKTALILSLTFSTSAFAFTYQCRDTTQTTIVNVTVGGGVGNSSIQVLDQDFNQVELREKLTDSQITNTRTFPATRTYVLARRASSGGISGMKPAIILTIEAGTRKGSALFEGKKLVCQMMVTRD
jgi:hypothetical protein